MRKDEYVRLVEFELHLCTDYLKGYRNGPTNYTGMLHRESRVELSLLVFKNYLSLRILATILLSPNLIFILNINIVRQSPGPGFGGKVRREGGWRCLSAPAFLTHPTCLAVGLLQQGDQRLLCAGRGRWWMIPRVHVRIAPMSQHKKPWIQFCRNTVVKHCSDLKNSQCKIETIRYEREVWHVLTQSFLWQLTSAVHDIVFVEHEGRFPVVGYDPVQELNSTLLLIFPHFCHCFLVHIQLCPIVYQKVPWFFYHLEKKSDVWQACSTWISHSNRVR